MQCVILAAGRGTRLSTKGPSKPLVPVQGTPLIEHVITRARAGSIDEFLVVVGYKGEEVRAELDRFGGRHDIRIAYVANASWREGNGISVLAARPHVDEEFVLAMCDHIFDPGIVTDLVALPPEPGVVTLAVDGEVEDPINDLDDATRVLCKGGRIQRIGKRLSPFNALDTGLFRCTSVMFSALEESGKRGDDSISGAMSVLAERSRARTFDIGGRLWIDVDDAPSHAKAEGLLKSGRL